MAQTAYPFETVPATVGRWGRMARLFAPSGVVAEGAGAASPHYLLTTSGLTVTIGYDAGSDYNMSEAFVRGFVHQLDTAPWSLAVPANTATSARVDRIVLRRDLAAQTVTLVHLKGAPAATPTPPLLAADDNGLFDLPLWSFTVPANSGTALTGIVDERRWCDPAGGPRGLVKANETNANANTSTAAEARLAGPQNMLVQLQPGRAYVASISGRANAVGGGGTAQLLLRAALGVTPTINSAAVYVARVYLSAAGGAGQVDLPMTSRAFAVAAAGLWNIHTFAVVTSSASMTGVGFVAVNIPGQTQVTLTDVGPAGADVPVITHIV